MIQVLKNGTATIAGVTVYQWNPRRSLIPGPVGRRIRLPYGPRHNNFGDLIGPVLVEAILDESATAAVAGSERKLMAVGSVLHFATSNDVVWGAGVNGKVPVDDHQFDNLDVRAVRGPRTRQFLQGRGVDVPEIYGDPALLMPRLFPEIKSWAANKTRGTTVVPNLNDWAQFRSHKDVLDPRTPLWECVRTIAESERVVASSLHGIIVAESLGVPVSAIQPRKEHPLKYMDYFEGTGRSDVKLHEGLDAALKSRASTPPLNWNPDPLVSAFPFDMWR